MKVLVYGAGGSQQFPVLKALKEKGATIFATTHQEEKKEALEAAGANVVIANMADRERLMEITKGIDAVSFLIPFFLENPMDGFLFAKNAIDAAVENGVGLFVWNTSGFILPVKIGNPAMDVRLDVADYLKSSGLPFIRIEPSVYAENLLGPWTAPYVKNEHKLMYPTPEAMPVGWIATQDVAAFVAEALFRPHLAGKSFQVSGLENLTGNQLAEKFSSGLNQQVTYTQMQPSVFGQILDQLFGQGAGKGAEKMYQEITVSGHFPVMYNEQMKAVLQELPVTMTDMKEWVALNQRVFN